MRFNSHRASRYLLFITPSIATGTWDSNIGCQDNRLHSSENIPLNAEYFYSYLIRLENEREREREREGEKRETRVLHARDSRTYTRIETQSFQSQGVAGQLRRSGRVARVEGGGSRGAPSYFTVITVTCYRARSLRHAINRRLPLPYQWMEKEGKGKGDEHGGLLWCLNLPSCVSTNLQQSRPPSDSLRLCISFLLFLRSF